MDSLKLSQPPRIHGFTIIELLVSVAMGALILAAAAGLLNQTFTTNNQLGSQNDTHQDARFAMQRMAAAVTGTTLLILPTADNPNTTTHPLNAGVQWIESIREQTVPATVGREFESAVLALALPHDIDTDQDGRADADNDRDGRVDEDPSWDLLNDNGSGVLGIDDDGDGSIDEGHLSDDDEDGSTLEDRFNGIDDDGDGRIDEDSDDDQNQDGSPGIVNIDDDSDGNTDEGSLRDDDEDGANDEDWPDALVFFLQGSTLIERRPNVHATSGTDYVENPIAENVTRFRVERIPQGTGRAVTVQLTLELVGINGESMQLDTQLRIGGAS